MSKPYAELVPHGCIVCGTIFESKNPDTLYCGNECWKLLTRLERSIAMDYAFTAALDRQGGVCWGGCGARRREPGTMLSVSLLDGGSEPLRGLIASPMTAIEACNLYGQVLASCTSCRRNHYKQLTLEIAADRAASTPASSTPALADAPNPL